MKKINSLLLMAFVVFFVLSSCNEKKVYDEPKQLITRDLAVEFNSNYNLKMEKILNDTSEYAHANAVWYSIEELENYINYVKTQGSKKGYNVNGIRMYLGVYPNKKEYGKKKGMTTIFLTPTGNKIQAEKGSFLNITTAQEQTTTSTDEDDIDELRPMNFGTMGHPPKMVYPSN
jgi:hypothetical protein